MNNLILKKVLFVEVTEQNKYQTSIRKYLQAKIKQAELNIQ